MLNMESSYDPGILPLENCTVLVIMNNAVIIIKVKIFVWMHIFISLLIYLGKEPLDCFLMILFFKNILCIFDFLLLFNILTVILTVIRYSQYTTYSVVLYAKTYQTYIK